MKRVLFSLALFVWPMIAFGHATPTYYEPTASSIVQKAPVEVYIRFSERVEPTASDIRIFAPDGAIANDGEPKLDPTDPHGFIARLKNSGSGTYTVSWSVTSADDGHFTKGAFGFSVGTASAQVGTQFQIEHRSAIAENIAIWLELLGHALLLGALVVYSLFHTTWKSGTQAPSILRSRLIQIVQAGTFFIIVGTIGYLCARAFGSSEASFLESFESSRTTVAGHYAWGRMSFGILAGSFFLLLLRASTAPRRRILWQIGIFTLIAILAVLRARVSHAAASPFWPVFSVIVNAVHLLGKNLWIGTVLAFAWAMVPALNSPKNAQAVSSARARLSQIVSIAFGIGGVTGAYIVWLHLKSWMNIQLTHWGMVFLALSIFAALLLFFRLWQMFVTDAATDEKRSQQGTMALYAEAVTAMAVLMLSSTMIITTPPRETWDRLRLTQQSQGAEISIGQALFDVEQFQIDVKNSTPVENLTVTLTNDKEDIGPIVVPTQGRLPGSFLFPMMALSPPGQWKIDVTASRTNAYDATASFTIDNAKDVMDAHVHEYDREFDGQASASIIVAIVILLASILLYRKARWPDGQMANRPFDHLTITFPRKAAAMLVITTSVLLFFLANQLLAHGHGQFQRECEQRGHMWHESVPMRAGRAISDVTTMGCMVGMGLGQYHFPDMREYLQFVKPSVAIAEFSMDPQKPRAGQSATATIKIVDDGGKPVTNLELAHDRILHTIAINQDLETFQHTHVETAGLVTDAMRSSATFPVLMTFSKPGRYLIAVDFTVKAQEFSQRFYVDVDPAFVATPASPDEYTVMMDAGNPQAGVPQKITFSIERDGQPVTDLEQYLATPMHLAFVSADLLQFSHAHAELPQSLWDRILKPRDPTLSHLHQFIPDRFGPDLVGYVTFPAPGTYVVFGEFKHGGKVVTMRKTIEVR